MQKLFNFSPIVEDIKHNLFRTENAFTRYLQGRGGGKVSNDYRHFKETETWKGVLTALQVVEDQALKSLKIIDPDDKVRIARLQAYACLREAMEALVDKLSSTEVEEEQFGPTATKRSDWA